MRISDWSSDVCSSDLGARGKSIFFEIDLPVRRMFRHARQGQIVGEVRAEIGAGVREGVVGGKAEAEVERILPGEFEPLDPAARPVRRLRYRSEPAAGLIVHEKDRKSTRLNSSH